MRFITAIAVAISASASFVAAQDKCDAQNIRHLRRRLPIPHRRLQREPQRLHLSLRRLQRCSRLLQQLPW